MAHRTEKGVRPLFRRVNPLKKGPDPFLLVTVLVGALAGCSSSSGVPARLFITNTMQNAALGGIEGADALCAAQATAAGLDGDFRAWLSTSGSSVSSRLSRSSTPYVLVDGTVVANDWDDLVDGSIMAPVDLDADGLRQTGDVWTGTLATGDSFQGQDCEGFTTSSFDVIGLCGASASTSSTWTENITPRCLTTLRLYCIEQ